MTETKAYAVCLDCDLELEDRDAINKHSRETTSPTGEPGIIARSHSYRVVNPTPEEKEKSRVQNIVSSAVEVAVYEAIDSLDDAVYRGKITEEQVVDQLRFYPDFIDAWEDRDQ